MIITILSLKNLYTATCIFYTGYVGPGMLTAAVCGNVFASPPSSTVYEAIIRCAQDNPGRSARCRFTDKH